MNAWQGSIAKMPASIDTAVGDYNGDGSKDLALLASSGDKITVIENPQDTTVPETGALCSDNLDNDADGFTDSDDPGCRALR